MSEKHAVGDLPGFPGFGYVISEGGSGWYLITPKGDFIRDQDGRPYLYATVMEMARAVERNRGPWGVG